MKIAYMSWIQVIIVLMMEVKLGRVSIHPTVTTMTFGLIHRIINAWSLPMMGAPKCRWTVASIGRLTTINPPPNFTALRPIIVSLSKYSAPNKIIRPSGSPTEAVGTPSPNEIGNLQQAAKVRIWPRIQKIQILYTEAPIKAIWTAKITLRVNRDPLMFGPTIPPDPAWK